MRDPVDWFRIEDTSLIPSPSLLVYPERVDANIESLLKVAGSHNRLRPHIKTHKMPNVIQMHLDKGITRFKCATLAEAETLASTGAKEVLLAYQPVGPNIQRIAALASHYPSVQFAVVADTESIIRALDVVCRSAGTKIEILLDLDVGMGRTGIAPGTAAEALYHLIDLLKHVQAGGLHVYDGQVRDSDFEARKFHSDTGFQAALTMKQSLERVRLRVPRIVAGGSPTFSVHALRDEVELSPGTYVFWDGGYQTAFPDLPFRPAALVFTRVISKPAKNRICLDLGHKAIASENPISNRVRILGHENFRFVGHSEEHLVVETPEPTYLDVGDGLYGLPWHICPTVALHEEAITIENGKVTGRWKIPARTRKINF